MVKTGHRFSAFACIVLAFAVAFPAAGRGESPPAESARKGVTAPGSEASAPLPPAPAIGEKADRLLRDMGDYLKAAKEFSFHAEIMHDDLLASGQKILLHAASDLAVRRPDRFSVHQQGDAGDKRLWYDGTTLTLLDGMHNTYATEKAPPNIDATLEYLIRELGFTPPLSDLLYGDPYARLRQDALFGFYVGPTDVEGVRCHHLAFVEANIDWQIWIDAGRLRVPRKLVITYKTLPGAPQFIAALSDWDFTTRLPESFFKAELPEAAVKIDFLRAAKSPADKKAASDKSR